MAYNEGCDKQGKKYPHPERLKAYPQRVFAHGFINHKGAKIAKTGEAIRPMELVEQFGSDAYRYYFLSKFDYGSDGEYSLEHFKEVYNADLANSLGNLVSRTVGLFLQNFDGKLSACKQAATTLWLEAKSLDEYEAAILETSSYKQALEMVWKIIFKANQYIEQSKPWELVKTDKLACENVIRELIASLRIVSLLLKPFTPKVAEKIYTTFQWTEAWGDTTWESLQSLATDNILGMDTGIAFNRNLLDNAGKYPPLFPRVKVK
jgi:methionyl-tRNA synthetase